MPDAVIKNPRKLQRGWVLPFNWLIPIVIIGFLYFFGWKGLIYLLAIFLLITLGVYIYDLITSERGPQEINFWFHSDQHLAELGKLIAAAGMIKSFSVDGENVWEWIEEGSQDGEYKFNISRKHTDYNFPVIIRVNYHGKKDVQEIREQLGTQFAKALNADIKVGAVNYLSGNDYAFVEEGFFYYRH